MGSSQLDSRVYREKDPRLDDSSLGRAISRDNGTAKDINADSQFRIGRKVYKIFVLDTGEHVGCRPGEPPISLGFSYDVEDSIRNFRTTGMKNAGEDDSGMYSA